MSSFSATIGAQDANDGGDYPESPDLGLEELQKLSWRSGDGVAKVAFWVADAPDHDNEGAALKQAIIDTKQLGVHIYPVAASGTDDLLELSMRSAAQITGGRFIRAIGMELSGTYIPPAADTVIRTAGDPSAAGQCSLGGNQTVQIF